ncbi:MAG: hypothetical protein K2J11_07570 [Oscillospiraceae bacterium]|nr:hypothetical protein [Oscillospiraceae bacterium]
MDVFVEQIVKKATSGKDTAMKLLIGIGIGVLSAVCVFTFLFVIPFPGMGLLLMAGIFYGGFHLITNLDCEYEYIVTNGEIDVDKIIAKRKRVRLVTAKASAFEAFGEYNENSPVAADGVTTVYAAGESDSESAKNYYADFKHASAGNVRLIFTPEERVVDAIVPFMPAPLRISFKK